MKVLVAGGAGFIGSNLVHRLVAAGHKPVVVDNLLTGSPSNLPAEVPLHRLDCADKAYLEQFRGDKWDLIVHFAGASSAPLFEDHPQRAHEAVTAFQHSLEIARHGGAKVAFASTSSFYSRCPKPFREDMNIIPGTLYEFSKLAMENLASAYNLRYGVDIVAFRFFSVYGPRERNKGRYANVVSQFMWSMQEGHRPIVYGDGSQTRDFTHVDDLLDGLMLATEKSKGFQVYNIGTGVEHTFNQVVTMLNGAMKTDLPPEHIPNPVRNYVAETLADASKLRALGWKPKVDLATGVNRLVQGK